MPASFRNRLSRQFFSDLRQIFGPSDFSGICASRFFFRGQFSLPGILFLFSKKLEIEITKPTMLHPLSIFNFLYQQNFTGKESVLEKIPTSALE